MTSSSLSCKERLAKLKSKTSSETLMSRGFVILLLNVIFGILPISLHKSYILRPSACCCTITKLFSTVLMIGIIFLTVTFIPQAFLAFADTQQSSSQTDVIAIVIIRTSHVLGYLILLIRAKFVAKKLPGSWKLLCKCVQVAILDVHGANWPKWKKLTRFTIVTVLKYFLILIITEVLFINSYNFERVFYYAFVNLLSPTIGPDSLYYIVTGYVIWDVAALSHILVSILLNFFILVVTLCLQSSNQLLRKSIAEYTTSMTKLQDERHREKVDALFLYRLNHIKIVYSSCEDVMKSLTTTFGITILVEVLILLGNTLINLYFIISSIMMGVGTIMDRPVDFASLFISAVSHFYFLYRLAVACSKMVEESKKPLRMLKDIPYNNNGNGSSSNVMANKIHHFFTDIGNSSITLSAANYFQVNKFLITSLIGSLTTFLVVLIQFKQQDLKDAC